MLLRQGEEEVRLVLGVVHAAPEQVLPAGGTFDARIVAGGDEWGVESAGTVEQRRKLQVPVALDARDRGAGSQVVAHEVGHDVFIELPLEVHDVVRDVEQGRHAPRIAEIVERAAASERRLAVALVVELHRQPDHVVAFGGQQRRGDG